MTTYFKDNHTVIKADENKFLMRKDGQVYGEEISLGVYSNAENYDELPMTEWPDSDTESANNNVI